MEVDIPYRLLAVIVLAAALVGLVVQRVYSLPAYPRVGEGFYGGVVRGAGEPDCLRTWSEGARLLDLLDRKTSVLGAGSDESADRAELGLLLSKMACLKKDLLSPSGVVEATRHQAFETAHDRMAVAELCGMCLQQTISSRDLEISLELWRQRGDQLIRRLCTARGLSEAEATEAEALWKAGWEDIEAVATSRCLVTLSVPRQEVREAAPFEAPSLRTLGSYDYLYGGLSASGWNGAI